MKICPKEKCVGCFACYNACPKNCIQMKVDEEGFKHPIIDDKKCVDCGLCKTVCPVLVCNATPKDYQVDVYASFNKDENVREKSSSGGLFFAFAKQIIEEGGVVFGTQMAEDCYSAICNYAENEEGLIKFIGSKYLQSHVNDCYKKAKEFLNSGRKVLFSATPCQIAGLKTYLKKDYDNLYTLDFICHGVPSPKAWEEYLKEKEREFNSKAISVSFRNKDISWEGFSLKIIFKNGEVYRKNLQEDIYLKGFLRNIYLRSSCYECEFRGENYSSDLTIADYWGIRAVHPEIEVGKGVSCMLVRTSKGKELLEKIKSELCVYNSDVKFIEQNNICLIRSTSRPAERDRFFKRKCKKGISNEIENALNEMNDNRQQFKTDYIMVKKEKGKLYAVLYAIKHFKELF